ncbi:hypothetical protein EVB39_108 [Rhizobium phage RHph_TM3_3_9]|nr:hypothetical protein EVB39_108 [Rhizobium phage RHph_TM3_3_9]QIG68629.1 hypothetical protein EVB66_108 [Rhizobium phage RHph_TM3_3_13]QIG74487.1 hypothetical protein EVC09_107 [Rhizobium phage RHph_TM3_3_10]QXV74601.1 hypothetical protein [Rhizobium phage RHEph19]
MTMNKKEQAEFEANVKAGKIVGWRWKSPGSDRWQYVDGPEKPELGFTPLYAATVTYEPLTAYVEPPLDRDGTPFKLLPVDLETHLHDFEQACKIARDESWGENRDYWVKQLRTIDRIKALLT